MTLLDPTVVGLGVSVFVQVSLEKQVEKALEKFEQAMLERSEVMECYLMTGDSNYLLRIVVSDVQAFERFLLNHITMVSGVASVRYSFASNG